MALTPWAGVQTWQEFQRTTHQSGYPSLEVGTATRGEERRGPQMFEAAKTSPSHDDMGKVSLELTEQFTCRDAFEIPHILFRQGFLF